MRNVNDLFNENVKKEIIKTRLRKLLKILLSLLLKTENKKSSSLSFNKNELLNSLTSLKIKSLNKSSLLKKKDESLLFSVKD